MMKMVLALVLAGASLSSPAQAAAGSAAGHVRIDNDRIADVFRRVASRSAAFRFVLAQIDASDTFVYIEEGRCRVRTLRSCLVFAASQNGFRYVRIKVQSRELLPVVAAQLAHELQHAAEVASDTRVVDAGTLSALYRAIGFPTSMKGDPECWETRQALATERLVVRELDTVKIAGVRK